MAYYKDGKKLPFSEWTEEEQTKQKEWRKRYYEKNKDKRKEYNKKWSKDNKDKLSTYGKKWRESNKDKCVFRGIRTRARRLGVPFDLELEDITNYDTCPIFGFKLERGGHQEKNNSPSVDKIIPSKGYVKGNIQIISNKANAMKSDATPEELRMFAKWVLKTFPEEPDGQT